MDSSGGNSIFFLGLIKHSFISELLPPSAEPCQCGCQCLIPKNIEQLSKYALRRGCDAELLIFELNPPGSQGKFLRCLAFTCYQQARLHNSRNIPRFPIYLLYELARKHVPLARPQLPFELLEAQAGAAILASFLFWNAIDASPQDAIRAFQRTSKATLNVISFRRRGWNLNLFELVLVTGCIHDEHDESAGG